MSLDVSQLKLLKMHLSRDIHLVVPELRWGVRLPLSGWVREFQGDDLCLKLLGLDFALIRGVKGSGPYILRKSPHGGWHFKIAGSYLTVNSPQDSSKYEIASFLHARKVFSDVHVDLCGKFEVLQDGSMLEEALKGRRLSSLSLNSQLRWTSFIRDELVTHMSRLGADSTLPSEVVEAATSLADLPTTRDMFESSAPHVFSHGDLWPGNILVPRKTSKHMSAKIIDWELGQSASLPWWYDLCALVFIPIRMQKWNGLSDSERALLQTEVLGAVEVGMQALRPSTRRSEPVPMPALIDAFSALETSIKSFRVRSSGVWSGPNKADKRIFIQSRNRLHAFFRCN